MHCYSLMVGSYTSKVFLKDFFPNLDIMAGLFVLKSCNSLFQKFKQNLFHISIPYVTSGDSHLALHI